MKILSLLILFVSTTCYGQNIDSDKSVESIKSDLELDGLVIDDTRSKVGRDFYELFYSEWVQPIGAKNFTITIQEKPIPRAGTQVAIILNDDEIFKQFLQPRYEVIEEVAAYARQLTYNYLQNYKAVQKQLQGEDLSGSGIY